MRLRAGSPLRAALATLLLALVGWLVPARAAHAGEYVYWACHTPSGQATSIEGWGSINTMNDITWAYPGNDCRAGGIGAISATFAGAPGTAYPSGHGVSWKFSAPAGTRIGHVNLKRTYSVPKNGTPSEGDQSNGTTGAVFYKNDFLYDGDHVVEQCQRFAGCVDQGAAPRLAFDDDGPQSAVGFTAGCFGDVVGTCNGVAGAVRATAAVQWGELHLIDGAAPTTSSPGGSALSGQPLQGKESLTFNAADVGGGVWQGAVTLDDVAVYPRQTLDPNDGHCVVTPYYGGAEFGYATPCKASLSAALSLDTTLVSNGSHLLTATVWDAANNSAVVVSQRVTVANPVAATPGGPAAGTGGGGGGPNGSGGALATAHFSSSKRAKTVTVAYGSTLKVQGRLVDRKGKSISKAAVDVLETPATPGAPQAKVATVTTNAKGRFTFKAKPLADRTLVFAYAVQAGGTVYQDQRTYKVRVAAGVKLRASRSSARRGEKVTFKGVVSAGSLPTQGARVVIKVHQRSGWAVAAVPRTDQAGNFTWSHRFRLADRYGFKAIVLNTAGLQVRPGGSHTIFVRVR